MGSLAAVRCTQPPLPECGEDTGTSGGDRVPGRCGWTLFLFIPGTTQHFNGSVISEISYENDRRSNFSKSF